MGGVSAYIPISMGTLLLIFWLSKPKRSLKAKVLPKILKPKRPSNAQGVFLS